MPVLTSSLEYPPSSPFAILDDAYLGGSFKIVKDETARDQLAVTDTLQIGTLVKCQSSGIYWRVANLKVEIDDFGDVQNKVDWVEFKFEIENTAPLLDLYKLSRTSFTVDIEKVGDGRALSFPFDMKCYSFFLFNLRVSQPVKVEIQSRADKLDRNPYVFIARHDHLVDSGESFISYDSINTVLRTSAYNILVNEDPDPTTNFYFKIFKQLSMTKAGNYESNLVTIVFDYIPIET